MFKFFEALSIFDWITPSIGLIEDLINDPSFLQSNSWTFFVPYEHSLKNGWNVRDIENLLRSHGIKTWGGQITGGEYFFGVKLEQAEWAGYILLRNRVPVHERCLMIPRPKGDVGHSSTKNLTKTSSTRGISLPSTLVGSHPTQLAEKDSFLFPADFLQIFSIRG